MTNLSIRGGRIDALHPAGSSFVKVFSVYVFCLCESVGVCVKVLVFVKVLVLEVFPWLAQHAGRIYLLPPDFDLPLSFFHILIHIWC